ncbi:CBS domain-containing protein [Balneatrix alpica]|uniref:CBS domain-containing protein n=1 Tax=Balneatrix alpica TaxID=75684 RepID=A0ABV5Z840_9GAMM|nr:CBS domain-containing protein [Balneatrix alpica]
MSSQTQLQQPHFSHLAAAQVMTPQVLCAYEGWSIKRLTEFFLRNRISGAPVIAADHSLVGVVSLSDIIQFEQLPEHTKLKMIAETVYQEMLGHPLPESALRELSQHASQNCTVNQIMTPALIAADVQTPLPQVAALMVEHQIHRLFVTDEQKVVGVISSLDLLRLMAQSDD